MRLLARAAALAGVAMLALPSAAAADVTPAVSPASIALVPLCTAADGVTRVFLVTNSSGVDVPFSYVGTNSDVSGTGVAPAAPAGGPATQTRLELAMPSPNTNLRVLVDGVQPKKGQFDANPAPCVDAGPPAPVEPASPTPEPVSPPATAPDATPTAPSPTEAHPVESGSPTAPPDSAPASPVAPGSPGPHPTETPALGARGPAPGGETPSPATAAAVTDLDCADFPSRELAQAALEQDRSDPFGLDADGDGVACEGEDGGPATLVGAPARGVPAGLASTGGPATIPLMAAGGTGLLALGGGLLTWRHRRRTGPSDPMT